MSTDINDHVQADIAEDGTGARPRSTRWRSGRRLAAVATGTTIALGAGGIAYAATTEPAPTPSTSAPTTPDGSAPAPPADAPDPVDGDGPGGPLGHHGGPGIFGPGGMAVHGEQVVETEDGVYQTIATQRGTVDEVSDTEITVTSEDGYTRTYTLTADSLTFDRPQELDGPEESDDAVEVAAGDEVMLVATVESGTATVTRLVNAADLPTPGELPGPGDGRHGGGPGQGTDELPESGATASPDVEGSAA